VVDDMNETGHLRQVREYYDRNTDEAFSHCPDPDVFFSVQVGVLPPGSRLVIIDDCLSDGFPEGTTSARQRRLLDNYRRNWLLPGLRAVSVLKSIAEENGFHLIKDQNLTPFPGARNRFGRHLRPIKYLMAASNRQIFVDYWL
jgi:hypothetical protein